MSKILVREEPHQEPNIFPWDEGIQKRFHFDAADIAKLEEGGVVWIGETGYSVEDENEVKK